MSRSIKNIVDKAVDATIRMPLTEWNWSEGVALYGLTTLWKKTRDEKMLTFTRNWIDKQLEKGQVFETVNATAPCFTLVELYDYEKDKCFEKILRSRVDFLLSKAKRLGNGAYEHTLTETTFLGQMWVDTLFMAGLFLVKAGFSLGIPEAVEEGIRQYRIHMEKLQQDNGLLYHGFDEGKNRPIGCLWARGNAWATIVSIEILTMLGEDHEAREEVQDILNRQLQGLLKTQDLSGLWTTVLTDADTYLETSAAAGISYAVKKGIKLGYIDTAYEPMGEVAMKGVLAYTDWEGILRGVSAGTGVQNHSGEYHVIARDRIQGYGQGLLLMMLSELL